jgi:propanol-preferring alcohol dehydrogenase
MKAWHFHGTHQPLKKVLDKAEPHPGCGEIRVAVTAAGLCHTDVGVLEDEKFMPLFSRLPVAPGHEIAGIIDEIGEGVDGFGVGDRVAVWPSEGAVVGFALDGGYQEKVVVSHHALVPIPDGVPDAYAATAACAGMTAHGALMTRGGLRSGEKVGIIGVGGVGQIALRLAVLNGAEVYAVETNETVWTIAEELGAKRVVKDVSELADLQLDLIIDFAGFGTTTAAAIEAVGKGGRVVLVGMGQLETTINTYPLMLNEVDLRGNVGGSAQDIASVLEWMAKGEIHPKLEEITWDLIAEGVHRLQHGLSGGRLVAIY